MESGGGHGLISATLLARPVTRSSLGLYSCGLIHVYYLSVSFSYLRSAAGVSFDIKKACRKPYTPPIGGGQLSSFVLYLVVLWGPSLLIGPFSLREAGPRPPGAPQPPLLHPRPLASSPGDRPRLLSVSPTSWVSHVSCGSRAALPLSRAPFPSL